MNLVTVTGPPASGKDAIIDALLEYYNRADPGKVARSIYCSTRQPRPTDRPGENVFLVDRDTFVERQQRGEIVSTDVSNGDLVGHLVSELTKAPVVFASVSGKNLHELRKLVGASDGQMMALYLDVPLEVRRGRLMQRQDSPDPSYVESKLANGVGFVAQSERSMFDRIYQNPDGQLAVTVAAIVNDLSSFVAGATARSGVGRSDFS